MKLITDFEKVLPINELYVAVQGEGSRAGMPTIIIRTLGCTHRCWFGEAGGYCDAWNNSWKLEKGKYTFQDIINLYNENPQITEMMLTGGAPTMHPDIVFSLLQLCRDNGLFMTMETEGSHYLDFGNDGYKKRYWDKLLVSLSPKFSNTIPEVGRETPWGTKITEKTVAKHNKDRLNEYAIRKWIENHQYHYKPVWDGEDEVVWNEIRLFAQKMNIPRNKTWVMPAGDTRDKLIETYPKVIERCQEVGFNFSPRPHIIAFDNQRCV